MARSRSEFGTVDALVSNAGVARLGRLADGAAHEWASMIEANVRGLLHGIAAVMPVFIEQGHGHVISTVSTAGLSAPRRVHRRGRTDDGDISRVRSHRTRRRDERHRALSRPHDVEIGSIVIRPTVQG